MQPVLPVSRNPTFSRAAVGVRQRIPGTLRSNDVTDMEDENEVIGALHPVCKVKKGDFPTGGREEKAPALSRVLYRKKREG